MGVYVVQVVLEHQRANDPQYSLSTPAEEQKMRKRERERNNKKLEDK